MKYFPSGFSPFLSGKTSLSSLTQLSSTECIKIMRCIKLVKWYWCSFKRFFTYVDLPLQLLPKMQQNEEMPNFGISVNFFWIWFPFLIFTNNKLNLKKPCLYTQKKNYFYFTLPHCSSFSIYILYLLLLFPIALPFCYFFLCSSFSPLLFLLGIFYLLVLVLISLLKIIKLKKK